MDTAKWIQIKDTFWVVLELPLAERSAVLDTTGPEIRSAVEKMLASHEQAEGFIDKPVLVQQGIAIDDASDEYLGKTIGHYRIKKRIGAGGMGLVYLAGREDSDQLVAIKLIKRGMDTEAILKRFLLERRILSRLTHPFIARLLDSGQTDDGLPYFVMEYVEGLPLLEYCDDLKLGAKERLELFRQVCSAISYAHQNLIVHRDLKPSNILITNDGTPKLLDFGIAKLLETESENTATQARIFTPEYASPEQLNGMPITTSADVYSLGVVLYELLSGTRPFRSQTRNFTEITNKVLTQAPVRPSSVISGEPSWPLARHTVDDDVKPQMEAGKFHISPADIRYLKGDVDNIILKALRKEPERRYASVQDLAEDIRRNLVGLPVTATADSRTYRARKFVKRHSTAVFAGSFIVLTLLLATSVTSWQAIVARRERDKSERRFDDVRKLSNSFLFEFDDAIRNLQGATPARKLVIDRALPFLNSLAEESDGDDSLQNELAESYRKLGEIQGHPYFANVGDVAGGILSFRRSIDIGEKLVSRNPTNQEYKINLSKYYDMLGDMYLAASYDTPNASANYQRALKLREELRDQSADDPLILESLMVSYERVGYIKAKTGELAAAINNFQASLAIGERLAASQPANNRFQRDRYVSYSEIGRVLHSDGKYREAIEQFDKGRTIVRDLMADRPNDVDLPRMVGIFDDLTANAHIQLGEFAAATSLSNNALAAREKLFAADPTNVLAFGDLTVSLDTAGDLRVKAGDAAGALKLLRRSLAMREAALKQDPTMTLAKRYIAISHNKIALVFRSQNDLPMALNEHRAALNINRELAGADPTNLELRRELSVSLQGVGEVLGLIAVKERDRIKWTQARELLDESLGIYGEMSATARSFGADVGKIPELKAFIEKHEPLFTS
ncbi:MAG: serine/threonine protein kinase [Chloracidobacterium sp.]|nr:serine/threonine protein kinase [Chloracidobacterium sp.]